MSRQPALSSRLILSVFMAILMYIGITMLTTTIRELMEAREAMAWPTTTGKVTRSEMKVQTQHVRRRSSDGIRRTHAEEYYEAAIEYEFQVQGVTYRGNRWTAVQGGNLADRAHVQKTLSKYPVDQTVTVSFKPDDPNQCLLEPGNWGGYIVMAGLPLFLIIIAGAIMAVAWSRHASKIFSGM